MAEPIFFSSACCQYCLNYTAALSVYGSSSVGAVLFGRQCRQCVPWRRVATPTWGSFCSVVVLSSVDRVWPLYRGVGVIGVGAANPTPADATAVRGETRARRRPLRPPLASALPPPLRPLPPPHWTRFRAQCMAARQRRHHAHPRRRRRRSRRVAESRADVAVLVAVGAGALAACSRPSASRPAHLRNPAAGRSAAPGRSVTPISEGGLGHRSAPQRAAALGPGGCAHRAPRTAL